MFRPNPLFVVAMMSEEPYIRALEESAGEAAKEANKLRHRIMPRTGRSGDAIEVIRIDNEVYLSNTDHGAHLDEWGSRNNPAYAPLRNGVRRAGFSLIED